ncbi:hypothetical protein CKO28_13110 [Rhodovibrio sodomensis]|uniref:Uncharacterized protein n=1 Tax=Rhodovibrio sodomensis TaxID=1088 RepID=A0ABS1DES2_9PROT|nr:hypothetical protein [Rhodovibrio sodomensis]MBK1668971.1 hypothetical protein [Rhodovibrio sodomensis]
MKTIDGWQLLAVMLCAVLLGLAAGKSATGQQSVNLDSQQIDDPEMARCILKHHNVGSDAMTRYVVGACRTVVGAD